MNDTLVIVTGIILLLLIGVLFYLVVFNRMRISKINEDTEDVLYNQFKSDKNTTLSYEVNKNIIDYINSLDIVEGDDLKALKQELQAIMNQTKSDYNMRMNKHSADINSNRDMNSVINIKTQVNASEIANLENKLALLRKNIKYDFLKISLRFIDEYNDKYSLSKNEKDMLVNTHLLYLLHDDVIVLFDKEVDKPDLFVKQNKEILMSNMLMLLNVFGMYNYYMEIDSVNYTCYSDEIPVIYGYIVENRDSIDFTSEKNFIFNTYLPRLVQYITNNEIVIYKTIDEMMISYYAKFPTVSYFNEFLTSINILDVMENSEHLFVKIMKYIFHNDLNFENQLTTRFTENELHLLFVLIPEYLISIKYNNDYQNRYVEYIKSAYFMNITESTLHSGNILAFSGILKMFTCTTKNLKNNALKVFLSDSLSHIYTQPRYIFEHRLLKIYNNIVRTNPNIISSSEQLDFVTHFVCNATTDEESQ